MYASEMADSSINVITKDRLCRLNSLLGTLSDLLLPYLLY